MLVMKGVRCK